MRGGAAPRCACAIALAVAAAVGTVHAADAGYPTLLVDLDPQCNATVGLKVAKDHEPNVYDVLSGDLLQHAQGDHRALGLGQPLDTAAQPQLRSVRTWTPRR